MSCVQRKVSQLARRKRLLVIGWRESIAVITDFKLILAPAATGTAMR